MTSPLLDPASVALVGASDDPAKTASRPLQYLRRAGYQGAVYPVTRRETVLGEPAWPSLDALPRRPDHAFILLPTDPAIQAVADCVRLGIPAVIVLASGFADAGADGAAKEARLADLVRGTGTRLLGPSSMGVANLHRRLVLTVNAAFAEPDLPRGGLFVASQSGSMIGALASRGKARGIGFACLVSVGGEADLDVGEVCAASLDDPETTAYLLFLETIRRGATLRAFALAAAERGKPVLAYKLGRSPAAAELAQSHTGALSGEDDVADAFLADCGIARVLTLEALLEAPALLRRIPPRRSPRPPVVGIVTTTGGGAAMVVDQLGVRGIDVQGPGPATAARLAAAGIEPGHGRILDLTLAGARYDIMKAGLDAMLADPAYDLVIAVPGSSARFQPDLAVRPVIDSAGDAARLAAFVVPEAPDALRSLADAGIPAFRTPESCADAVVAALRRRLPTRRLPTRRADIAASRHVKGRLVDEQASYGLLAAFGIPHAPCAEYDGGPTGLPFPVAVKLLSDQIAHKTDIGGVVLSVTDEPGLRAAAAQIRAAAARVRPGEPARIMVQQMATGLGEVLLGYRTDPRLGPFVLLAPGGAAAELYRDRSLRMAPIDLGAAYEMIAEVRGLAHLRGFRGRPPADLEALAAAVVALSSAAGLDPRITELEINPLLVRTPGQGVLAVDACAWLVDLQGAHGVKSERDV